MTRVIILAFKEVLCHPLHFLHYIFQYSFQNYIASQFLKTTRINMKFLTFLSMATFAAFAVAGPLQANGQGKDQVEKRQVLDPSLWLRDDFRDIG